MTSQLLGESATERFPECVNRVTLKDGDKHDRYRMCRDEAKYAHEDSSVLNNREDSVLEEDSAMLNH